jgi:hypothetical protein
MSKRRVGLFAALIAAVAALLFISSGCGGGATTDTSPSTASGGLDTLDGPAILAKAKAAADAKQSVHVKGDGSSGGETVGIDMVFTRAGTGKGTFTSSGVTFDIAPIGDTAYIKGNAAFMKQLLGPAYTKDLAATIGDKYISGPPSDPRLASLADFVDMEAFLKQVLTPDGKVAKSAGKTINGIPTVGIDDNQGTTNTGTMYVANDGTDLPVALNSHDGSKDGGVLNFDQWGTVGEITAPSPDQVIAIDSLKLG